MTQEQKTKISNTLKGRKPWNFGMTGTKPEGLTFKGRKHSKDAIEKISQTHLGKPKTQEHRKKISDLKKGSWSKEKNPRWKGGITKLVFQIRGCFQYRQWRMDVFTKDSFTCHDCLDNHGRNLQAHHLKFMSDIISDYSITSFEDAITCAELWDINNGITLCKNCHIKRHLKINK